MDTKISDLYNNFLTYCRSSQESPIVFFYLLEQICAQNYRDLKIKFQQQKLILKKKELEQITYLVSNCQNVPWQYLVKKGLFAGDWYVIEEPVFIPRHTSEKILWIFEKQVKHEEKISSILELGVGSGIVLKHIGQMFKSARLYGTDICAEALLIANKNCPEAKLWLCDWTKNLANLQKMEVIYANPPYIQKGEIVDQLTNRESRFALYGTKESILDYYREMLQIFNLPNSLLKYMVFEISNTLLVKLEELFDKTTYTVMIFKSYAANISFVFLKRIFFRWNNPIKQSAILERAEWLLKKNKVIVMPTDTCYGIVVRNSRLNIRRVNLIKCREQNQKIPVLFSDFKQLPSIDKDDFCYFKKQITVIYRRRLSGARKISEPTWIVRLINSVGKPLLSTSLNIHGQPIITELDPNITDKFPDVDAFLFNRKYKPKPPSKIISLERVVNIKVVRQAALNKS